MNTRQILTSTVAAATIVGAISLASAQSSTDPTTTPQPQTSDMTATPAPVDSTAQSTMPAQDSTATTSVSTDTSAAPAADEPAPKPDRN